MNWTDLRAEFIAARLRLNLRQDDVAAFIGVRRATFARYEGGSVVPPFARCDQWGRAVGYAFEVVETQPEATPTPPRPRPVRTTRPTKVRPTGNRRRRIDLADTGEL